MKKYTAIISFLLIAVLSVNVYAEVLGTVADTQTVDFGAGTYLHSTTFLSDQGTVGKQTEYYVEYTPNSMAYPVVENGMSVWGTRTIEEASQYIEDRGYRPLIGINGDYFSFTTGIPMGTSISRGEILTKTDGTLDAVGFLEDGSGFIDKLNIKTTLSDGNNSVNVECINRWYTKDYTPICLLTDKFAASTHTLSECLFLICSVEDGRAALGETLKLKVDDKFEYNGNIDIPEGKMVLLISKNGNPELYSFLNSISIGQEVEITNEAVTGDTQRWSQVQSAIGTSAGRLIENGNIGSGFEEGAAPRTAVGIKPDGNIIFYVLDGRQSGHSYGARIETIAKRLLELGCIDAINLDGGGSTAMAGVYPGSGTVSIINSPSDGNLRSCANYIFLQDMRRPTGIISSAYFNSEANRNHMSGTSTSISFGSLVDTSGYPMNDLGEAHLEVVNEDGSKSYIDDDNVLHFEGSGKVTVQIVNTDGSRIDGEVYQVYDEPESMKVYNENTWEEITEIYLKPNESYSVNLEAAPYVGGTELHSYDGIFEWSVEGDIGSIDNNGNYIAKTNGDKAGKIIISRGNFTKEINVFISGYNGESEAPFVDISGHWAQGNISYMAEKGIINGIEADGKIYFKPDNNMTRAEFAQAVAKLEGIDLNKYTNEPLVFEDSADIAPWAQNAAKAMYDEGIMTGRTGTGSAPVFAPNDNITRAEAMTILGRLISGEDKKALDFADKDSIPAWAEESMEKLYAKGIIQGYSDNTILPNNNVKRAEAITLMYKMIMLQK